MGSVWSNTMCCVDVRTRRCILSPDPHYSEHHTFKEIHKVEKNDESHAVAMTMGAFFSK
jgi:hypothetical protein